MKKYFVLFAILFVFAATGCRPGGGGGAGEFVSTVPVGSNPTMQELIIDETQITVSQLTDKSCLIKWKTNVPATSCVEYGQSMKYDRTTAEDKNLVLEHSIELYGLIPHTRYYFRVISSDVYKHFAQSRKEIYFETYEQNFAPAAVTLSAPTDITAGSMKLSWTQSFDDDFSRYQLYRDTTSAVTYNSTKVTEISAKQLTEYEDKNLNPNTLYYYVLYTFDTAELATASNVVSGTTSVLYNTLARINFNDPPEYRTTDSMKLTWKACAESDFASYRIYWSSKPGVDTLSSLEVEITDRSSTAVELKNLAENTTYYFRLYLKNKGNVFTASDEAAFRTYKNGECWKTVKGIYYGNDMKASRNKLYVAAYDTLYRLDPANQYSIAYTTQIPGQNARIRKNYDDTRLYIVNTTYKEIVVYDTVNDVILGRLPAGTSPTDVAVSIYNDYYFVPDFYEGTLNKYRLSDGYLEGTKYLGAFLTSAVAGRNNNDIFVSKFTSSSNEVVVVSPTSLNVKTTVNVATEPVYLYMDPGALYVYCSNYKSKNVSRINSLSGSFADSFEVGLNPSGIVQAPSGAYTFVANFGAANISMYSNAQNQVVETIADGITPKSLEVSPTSRELLVLDYEGHAVTVYALKK